MKKTIRKAKIETWKKKLEIWKKHMKLGDWDISIRYSDLTYLNKREEDFTIAYLNTCYIIEKKAEILVDHNYNKIEGYIFGWNMDTTIIHELTHVLLSREREDLPKHIVENKKVEKFEEFICDLMGDLLYRARARKSP